MLPIYFVIGLLNIFSQHHNYGIKTDDPNFDIRVRRSVGNDAKDQIINLHSTEENNLKRNKRLAYYKKTRITNNDIIPPPRYNENNNNNNNGSQIARNNRYDIFNPNWNFLFNNTNGSRNNNSGVNNPNINNRPIIISSYPYGYPPGYAPKTNFGTGINQRTTTTGYQNNNAPIFYNYQNPDGKNFAGFAGYSASKSGLMPYPPSYTQTTPAPYLPSYTQNPLTNIFNNNFPTANNMPASYKTTSNSGMHNLPYGTNPANGIYNNNLNSIPKPFVKDNLSPYAPNFQNGSANFNNGPSNINNGSSHFTNGFNNLTNGSNNFTNGSSNFTNGSADFNNGSYVPVNSTNATVTTTEKIVSGCVICNIPCPKFLKRFGAFCLDPDKMDDDY